MTSTPAIEWLDTEFDLGDSEIPDPGSLTFRPILTIKSATDPGAPMTVNAADYQDPGRWWL